MHRFNITHSASESTIIYKNGKIAQEFNLNVFFADTIHAFLQPPNPPPSTSDKASVIVDGYL